jgi:hypothetical protein
VESELRDRIMISYRRKEGSSMIRDAYGRNTKNPRESVRLRSTLLWLGFAFLNVCTDGLEVLILDWILYLEQSLRYE